MVLSPPRRSAVELTHFRFTAHTWSSPRQITSVTVAKESRFANRFRLPAIRGIVFGATFVCVTTNSRHGCRNFESENRHASVSLAPSTDRYRRDFFVGVRPIYGKRIVRVDINEMHRRSGGRAAREDFSRAVFRFTGARPTTRIPPPCHQGRNSDRQPRIIPAFARKNSPSPRSARGIYRSDPDSRASITFDADVLSAVKPYILNSSTLHGRSPYKDLRYFVPYSDRCQFRNWTRHKRSRPLSTSTAEDERRHLVFRTPGFGV